jgi:hypothetical protein
MRGDCEELKLIKKGGIKIRYLEFKNIDKYNITTLKNGDLKKSKLKRKKMNDFKVSESGDLKIPLTSKDRCECDKLVIDHISEEKAENMVFHFEFYYYEDRNRYSIMILCSKKELNFFKRMKKSGEERYWRIEVDKINDNGEVQHHCMSTLPGSAEGIELEKLFQKPEENIQEKIVAFLRKHKYNNICLNYENLKI